MSPFPASINSNRFLHFKRFNSNVIGYRCADFNRNKFRFSLQPHFLDINITMIKKKLLFCGNTFDFSNQDRLLGNLCTCKPFFVLLLHFSLRKPIKIKNYNWDDNGCYHFLSKPLMWLFLDNEK